MKANELMIGDWVRLKLIQRDTTVTNIDSNSVYTEAVFPLRCDEIEPIPLTPEILEKNGTYNSENYLYSISIFSLSNNYDGSYNLGHTYPTMYGTAFYTLTKIKYIHELQHALRLCGIKKEIEL